MTMLLLSAQIKKPKKDRLVLAAVWVGHDPYELDDIGVPRFPHDPVLALKILLHLRNGLAYARRVVQAKELDGEDSHRMGARRSA